MASFELIFSNFEIGAAKTHNKNISEPMARKTSTKKLRARSLSLRRCFERFSKDFVSSRSKSQQAANESICHESRGHDSSSNDAFSFSSCSINHSFFFIEFEDMVASLREAEFEYYREKLQSEYSTFKKALQHDRTRPDQTR
jgi:hypothetical protein